MWRGLVVGSVALVVLYVVAQNGASGRISQGGGLVAGFIRRMTDPSVAGVPDRSRRTSTSGGAASAPPPAQGSLPPGSTQVSV